MQFVRFNVKLLPGDLVTSWDATFRVVVHNCSVPDAGASALCADDARPTFKQFWFALTGPGWRP